MDQPPTPPRPNNEPKPPWVVSRSITPGDDPHWLTPAGQAWLRDVFLPFYDALGTEAQRAYCNRWNAPSPWIILFLHPELDRAFADADEQDGFPRVEPLDDRHNFGLR